MQDKEYTFEDMQGKSDKEVTAMLKHNKRLRGWDGVEVKPEPVLAKCVDDFCSFEREVQAWERVGDLACEICGSKLELKR